MSVSFDCLNGCLAGQADSMYDGRFLAVKQRNISPWSFLWFYYFNKSDYLDWSLSVFIFVVNAVARVLINNLLKTLVSLCTFYFYIILVFVWACGWEERTEAKRKQKEWATGIYLCAALLVACTHYHPIVELVFIPFTTWNTAPHLNFSLKMSFNRKYVMFAKWDVSCVCCHFCYCWLVVWLVGWLCAVWNGSTVYMVDFVRLYLLSLRGKARRKPRKNKWEGE